MRFDRHAGILQERKCFPKAAAATSVQKEWGEFKASWAKLESRDPTGMMTDPAIKRAGADVMKAGIDVLDKLLK